MPDYKTMYFRMMGKVTDAMDQLIAVQRECETMFMEDEESAEIAAIDKRREDKVYKEIKADHRN